jgi:Na+-translocating ferredoxin:NAD+ oxidoreductase RnfG subunit
MEAIVVALIAAVGGVLTALVQKSRKENTRDHALVVEALDRIETKIDDHVRDHAVGKFRSRKAV